MIIWFTVNKNILSFDLLLSFKYHSPRKLTVSWMYRRAVKFDGGLRAFYPSCWPRSPASSQIISVLLTDPWTLSNHESHWPCNSSHPRTECIPNNRQTVVMVFAFECFSHLAIYCPFSVACHFVRNFTLVTGFHFGGCNFQCPIKQAPACRHAFIEPNFSLVYTQRYPLAQRSVALS